MTSALILTLITTILIALFSGVEIAFLNANRLKIELKISQGGIIGRTLNVFYSMPSRFIATILIGNNLALVIYSLNFSDLLLPWLNSLGLHSSPDPFPLFLVQTCLSTLFILIIAEYLPKMLFRYNSEILLEYTAPVMQFFYYILSPFVRLSTGITSFILATIFKKQPTSAVNTLIFSKQDLNAIIQGDSTEKNGKNSTLQLPVDAEIFSKALSFNKIKVREFMVPRTEIVAISIHSTIEELHKSFIEFGVSRMLIFENSIDQIKGYIHSNSLFSNPNSIAEVLQTILLVPESMAASTLFREFKLNRKTIAVVVDEFGGTSGLVTLEDLIEVVFGEIRDEFDETTDEKNTREEKITENAFVFSSRLEIEYLNKKYNLQLPTGDYTTLGGLVFQYFERIPEVSASMTIGNYIITISEAHQNKVELVRLDILENTNGAT
ncbi:MAG: hemolysin family protein [Bacteroidia bacterium]|nr:hemolysin family protein [Bacteroidia bacterium]